ncbi:hypothetical protein [Paenibacillus sp. SI8]|uniref:hypothetical protein n=1 Tax=unclassified Paenibacillus TaxID=185978 RepID=UPI003466B3F0
MKSYLKLLQWEINRFGKFYAVLLLITALFQMAGVSLFANNYMASVRQIMERESVAIAAVTKMTPLANFDNYTQQSLWFVGPIALCAGILVLYVFLTWYREWFGKNTFAYRLFMLPVPRMQIYLAKAVSILLFVLGLVAVQLLLIPLQALIFQSIIPEDLRKAYQFSQIIRNHPYLNLLAPRYFVQFILYYGAGIMGLLVIFTAILLERSYRVKGIIAGVVYVCAAGAVIISPLALTENWLRNYFYPSEILGMFVVLGLLICGFSLWLSARLLQKKVSV